MKEIRICRQVEEGTSRQFDKPLVIDQETRVTLRYKRR